jgi:hypothetical protein
LEEKDDDEKMSIIRVFFYKYWVNIVRKLRYPLLGFALVWIIVSIWRCATFTEEFEELRFLPKSHWLYKLEQSLLNDYHNTAGTTAVTVSLIYGTESIDSSGVSMWDARNAGTLIFDDEFDLAPEANQLRIVEICNSLKTSQIVDNAQVT